MAEETGSSMFGCFPVVLIAVIFGFLAFLGVRQGAATAVEALPPVEAQATVEQANSTQGGLVQSFTVIETVETEVSATVPATITLHLKGYQPDGCKLPVAVQQTRSMDKVIVSIYRSKPIGVMCTMDLNPYEDTITLSRPFESGTYTIDVNGTVVIVHV